MPPSPSRSKRLRALPDTPAVALLVVVAVAAPACAPPPSPPGCREDPFACAAGTTCWPTDERGGFSCLPGKPYKAPGSECDAIAGRTSCAAGHVCITTDAVPDAGALVSYCAAYCDAKGARPCPAPTTCALVAIYPDVPESAVHACVDPMPLARDAGVRDGP